MFDGEYGAEVYSVANKLEQASICFDAGCIMMKALQKDIEDESISGIEIFNSQNHRKIVNRENNSFFRPIPTEAKTQDGYNVHGGIIDEYHEATDDSSLRILETGTVARTQPMIFIITTAGFNRNGPCYQLRKVMCDILQGKKKDDSLFGLIFSLDEGDDWEDEKNWVKANPSIGITPTWEAMRSQYTKAKNEGETARINFLTKNLNIWTTVSQVWLKDEDWMRNAGPIPDLRGRPCYAGLDLASVRDITALVLFFPATSADEQHVILPYFWVPEDGADQRSREDGVPYLQWIADGVIEATPGNVTDYAWVKSRILDLCELYQPRSIAYDRFNASQLVIELQDEGIKMEPFGQGFVSMSAPTRQIEKMVLSCELNHGGNEVMRWMCGNVTLKMDPAGNVKMDKGRSQEKIDGMVALAMAIGEWMTNSDPGGSSKYETESFTFI
jgi:phage terminase large subunit-like protein